jgi:uncharacterized protein (DUF2141 family)
MKAPIAIASAGSTGAQNVTVRVTDLRSDKGLVRACMTTRADLFPNCRDDPHAHRKVIPAGQASTITFFQVVPGAYAIALLHDENGNGKADRALGMMPKEGFGFSRDAKVRMAPPRFEDAVFNHDAKPQNLTIRMRYLL